MHEASIAKGIIDTAVAALPRPGNKILKITVAAGVMAGVERESLELYFTELSKGTPAQGAALEVKHLPAKLICRECNHQVDYDNTGDLAVRCEACGGANRLQGGDELYIESMEIEDE
jgi:hydrogenase nickel incorporation protein HypA/HybF